MRHVARSNRCICQQSCAVVHTCRILQQLASNRFSGYDSPETRLLVPRPARSLPPHGLVGYWALNRHIVQARQFCKAGVSHIRGRIILCDKGSIFATEGPVDARLGFSCASKSTGACTQVVQLMRLLSSSRLRWRWRCRDKVQMWYFSSRSPRVTHIHAGVLNMDCIG